LARLLATFGASLDDVVDEVIYVTDMDAAFAVAGAGAQSCIKIEDLGEAGATSLDAAAFERSRWRGGRYA